MLKKSWTVEECLFSRPSSGAHFVVYSGNLIYDVAESIFSSRIMIQEFHFNLLLFYLEFGFVVWYFTLFDVH